MGMAEVSKNLAFCDTTARRIGNKFALSLALSVTLLASLLSSTLSAQTNAGTSAPRSANRYLFIVETSHAMRLRAQGVFEALKRALDSNLNGQIHQGDLVGIWTFNESVYEDLFPTQIWSQPTQLAFAVRLPTFADPQLYQKRARLDKVVPEMLKLMAGNENVTIILVSTGEGVLDGTPFRESINSAWKEWYDEQEGVHMPLQTVMRARNSQPTDWFLAPAPRPIEFPKLAAAPKSLQATNPAGVILESGLVTNQPSLGAEQKVAFSVWALGRTGVMASANSPKKSSTRQPKLVNSAPPATASATETSTNQSLSTADTEQSKGTVVPATTTSSNAQPAETGKPVELVFVTNAPAQPTPTPDAPVTENTPAATASPTVTTLITAPPQPAASRAADIAATQPLLAHARAADPAQEEKNDLALATPPRGFLRDNIKPMLLMIVAGFGAVYCFRMWLRTNTRTKGSAFSLTQSEPDESLGQEQS
jgi:hypothetical protein